jgi:hypothetical protein
LTKRQKRILNCLSGYFQATHGDWITREDIVLLLTSGVHYSGSFMVKDLDSLTDAGLINKKLFKDRFIYRITDNGLIEAQRMV